MKKFYYGTNIRGKSIAIDIYTIYKLEETEMGNTVSIQNMSDAIKFGTRLIMLSGGKIIFAPYGLSSIILSKCILTIFHLKYYQIDFLIQYMLHLNYNRHFPYALLNRSFPHSKPH